MRVGRIRWPRESVPPSRVVATHCLAQLTSISELECLVALLDLV